MGRVEQGGSAATAGPASQRHHKQLTDSIKPTYKVVLEEVTQTRKAMRIENYHNINPPRGYKFVPAGDPTLTTKCKEFARLEGKIVYAVVNTGKDNTELSKQVHRIGFHFPSEIVQRACKSLGIDLEQEDNVLSKHETWPEGSRRGRAQRNIKQIKRHGKVKVKPTAKGLDIQHMSQEEIDAQAKAAILDMFPAIPQENLYQVILHGFELGTDRVGVQLNDLSLPRRVQLAVVAHIRHVYTDYDQLLRRFQWKDARQMVGPKTLEVLASWRGDKDDDLDVVEDILREVIVISDDEEDEPAKPVTHPVLRSSSNNVPITFQQQDFGASQNQRVPALAGRSNRNGAMKQVWLDARERRKEPIAPLRQIQSTQSYQISQNGRDIPVVMDQAVYERRLRGIETQHSQDSARLQPQVTSGYPVVYTQQQQITRSNSMRGNDRGYEIYSVNQDPYQPVAAERSISSGGRILAHAAASSSQQIAPHALDRHPQSPMADDIIPSIETPKSERAPAETFVRGIIHVDSPPSESRPRMEYLPREPANPSPVKRKRSPSPRGGTLQSGREVVYLPIREQPPRTRYEADYLDYGQRSAPEPQYRDDRRNQVVYLPLDENNRVKSLRPLDGRPAYVASPNSTAQIYLDKPPYSAGSSRPQEPTAQYHYLPLGPTYQNRPDPGYGPSNAYTQTRLIPLDGHRMAGTESYQRREPVQSSNPVVYLDTPSPQNQRSRYALPAAKPQQILTHGFDTIHDRGYVEQHIGARQAAPARPVPINNGQFPNGPFDPRPVHTGQQQQSLPLPQHPYNNNQARNDSGAR